MNKFNYVFLPILFLSLNTQASSFGYDLRTTVSSVKDFFRTALFQPVADTQKKLERTKEIDLQLAKEIVLVYDLLAKEHIRFIPNEQQLDISARDHIRTISNQYDFDHYFLTDPYTSTNPLLLAASENKEYTLQELIEGKGASVNVADRIYKLTPLHHAVIHQNLEAVQTLLRNRANTNALDLQNQTPLFFAEVKDAHLLRINSASQRDQEKSRAIMFELVRHGANPEIGQRGLFAKAYSEKQFNFNQTPTESMDKFSASTYENIVTTPSAEAQN